MKAVAVFPGKPNSAHLREVPKPSVDSIPDGRGILVKVLRVGLDGTDKEINALWYNALRAMADFARRIGESGAAYETMADRTGEGFRRFWNTPVGYCFDVIDGPDGNDDSLRPNQLLAVSLPHSPLPEDRRKAVVDACARDLLTPLGLRSLARSSSGFLRLGVRIQKADRPMGRHRMMPIPLWRFDMQAKRKVISSLLVVVFTLFTGLAMAAGEQKAALKADKAGKGASGEAVIVDKGGDQKGVTVTAKGLKPNSVYTVWLVNMKPKMDMAGLGEGDYSFKSDDKGNASYSATIGSPDFTKWQLIELAYHPSGDPKNMKEMENTALVGKLKK